MIPITILCLVALVIITSWAYHDAILTSGNATSAWMQLLAIFIASLLVFVPFALFITGLLSH